jgi:Spy/CpxP family protein refolding chaperone
MLMSKRVTLFLIAVVVTIGFVSVALSTNPTDKPSAPQVSAPQEPGKAPAKQGCRGFKRFLAAQLGLSEDQIAQIRALKQNFKAQLRSLPPEERRARFQELKQEFREKVRSILTPEQRAKWDELKARWKAWRAEGRLKKIGNFIRT